MIPLHDDNPTRTTPVLTYALIAANVLVFLYQLGMGEIITFQYALIPFQVTGAEPAAGRQAGEFITLAERYNLEPAWATLFTSMFLHGSFMHLLGNMVFLAIFGNNVEDVLGKVRFLLFYLGCGAAAGGGHLLTEASSFIPTVGASGAIAGVLGGYYLLFPRARVTCLFFVILIAVIDLPASLVLGIWFVLQLLMGLQGWGMQEGGGVAYAAHVGGFVAGFLLIKLLGAHRPEPPRRYYPQQDRVEWR